MYKKPFIILIILALLFQLASVACASAEDPYSATVTATVFTFPINFLTPEGSSVPSVSVEITDDAWILTTDYVPVFNTDTGYEENRIHLKDQKRVQSDSRNAAEIGDVYESKLDGLLDFKPDGDVWSTRNIRRGYYDGTNTVSTDQINLQFDPAQIAEMTFSSSIWDTNTDLTTKNEIIVTCNMSAPRVVVSVTDAIQMYPMDIATITRRAAYDAETGLLVFSSISETDLSVSKSYTFDAYGKLTAFSVLDRESYESVSIHYDEEFGAWIDTYYQVIEDLEQAASEIGIDLTREAPVKNQ